MFDIVKIINEVLPKGYKKVVIEFSNDPSWYKIIEQNDEFISVNDFGKSGKRAESEKDDEIDQIDKNAKAPESKVRLALAYGSYDFSD